MQSQQRSEDADRAPLHRTKKDVRQAVRQAARLVRAKKNIEDWPRKAVALRDLCEAVFDTDGRIQGLPPEEFSHRGGHLLFRGVNFFSYVCENLNGGWFGTGFMSDGNYYAGSESREEAIHEYGFSNPYGWAMAYKLRPSALLTEQVHVEQISLDQFIASAEQQYNIDADALAVLYEKGNDNGFRAVLLGYDGMVDRDQDHYVIYNHRTLVYRADCTPWARGLETAPEELELIERSRETARPQQASKNLTDPSGAYLIHELSRFQSPGMDRSNGIGLEYATVASEVRRELMEMRS